MSSATLAALGEIIQMLFDHGAQLGNALEYARRNHRLFPEHKASVDLLERLHGDTGS